MAATRRSNNFDFLRLFAAASVVITHSIANLDGTSFLWLDGDQQAFFYDGVPMFFILSGYLVYRSAQQNYDAGRPKRAYLRNRALRVLPAIAVYFAIVVIVELLFYGVPAVSALKWPSSLWRGIHFPNGSLWTIPVEISFYLAVPVFLWFERRAGTVRLLQGLLVLACIGAIFPLADENGLSNSITYHVRYSFTS
ncbi:MAG: acyltransferase, partial [Actinobacteria bacterium]|nr:acyltransferase [Actinomycetota bacterium]